MNLYTPKRLSPRHIKKWLKVPFFTNVPVHTSINVCTQNTKHACTFSVLMIYKVLEYADTSPLVRLGSLYLGPATCKAILTSGFRLLFFPYNRQQRNYIKDFKTKKPRQRFQINFGPQQPIYFNIRPRPFNENFENSPDMDKFRYFVKKYYSKTSTAEDTVCEFTSEMLAIFRAFSAKDKEMLIMASGNRFGIEIMCGDTHKYAVPKPKKPIWGNAYKDQPEFINRFLLKEAVLLDKDPMFVLKENLEHLNTLVKELKGKFYLHTSTHSVWNGFRTNVSKHNFPIGCAMYLYIPLMGFN